MRRQLYNIRFPQSKEVELAVTKGGWIKRNNIWYLLQYHPPTLICNMPRFLNRLLAVICSSSVISTIYAITPGFPYGSQKVRGVNLGGWLVLEVRWIFPCLLSLKISDKLVSSLGSRHPFLTILVTIELSMNIPLANTKALLRLPAHWSSTGTLGSLNQTLKRLPMLGMFPIASSMPLSLIHLGLIMYGFQSDTGHLTSRPVNLMFKANYLTWPRL